MSSDETVVLADAEVRATIDMVGVHGDVPPTHARVSLASGEQVFVPADLVVTRQDGSLCLPLTRSELLAGYPGVPSTIRIPVLAEQLTVRREVHDRGGVRVATKVDERVEVVDEQLAQEQLDVERVRVDRVVTSAPPVRYEGDVTIISLVEEVLVVERRLVVREEVRIRKHTTTTRHTEDVVLRREVASVDVLPPDHDGPS